MAFYTITQVAQTGLPRRSQVLVRQESLVAWNRQAELGVKWRGGARRVISPARQGLATHRKRVLRRLG